jgi:predicted transport protein
MPQNKNLSEKWINELGDDWENIQEKYLHTIGNLTLTGYNSELSDKFFIQKRDMEGGFADSPIRLNRGLAKLEHWNEAEIKARSQSLAELAMKIWDYPDVTNETLTNYTEIENEKSIEDTYSLKDHPYLTDEMNNLFEQLQKRILNLDASVTGEIKNHYITYKTTSDFVDVTPQKSQLKLSLNIEFDEIDDPQGICRDVRDINTWGNSEVEVLLEKPEQLDYMMYLIKQAFEKHVENVSVE